MFRPQDALDAIGRRYPRFVVAVSVLIGGVGVGYLWAALFGDGLHGAKTGAALDSSSTYPNADAAFLGVVGVVFASLYVWASAGPKGRRGLRIWAVSLAVVGLRLFGISRLFV